MNKQKKYAWVYSLFVIVSVAACSGPTDSKYSKEIDTSEPPFEDYCKMLERDIEGEHHGFLAGNKLYYVSGKSAAEWDKHFEFETLGFTHPIFRDGRARGYGIVNDERTGIGHDKWGWDFYRHNKGAKGTLILNGKSYEYPRAEKNYWRPDRQITEYNIDGVRIKEEKFISENDVLTDIITSDKDIEIVFDGESFAMKQNVPGFDGDDPTEPMMRGNKTKIEFDKANNAIHFEENGKIFVKTEWKKPVVTGDLMYNGLDFVISSDAPIENPKFDRDEKHGNVLFSFKIKIPAGIPVTLTYSVADELEDAIAAAKKVLKAPKKSLDSKTTYMNDLLNQQIPYFRCSDDLSVKTYYYLWSLYFMYFRDIEEGYLKYPHTQTAINNFMGLHLWDSWAYTQAGSWVADKWSYGHGNILSWQFMVPFKNKANQMPDNFGIEWRSMDAFMGFTGTVEPAWEQYRRSGDKSYLEEVYTKVFKPLYLDKKGPTPTFGIEINAINDLQKMAKTLGYNEDIAQWENFRKNNIKSFKNRWSGQWEGFFGGKNTPWKDIWALVALQSDAMPKEWGAEMIDKHVMDTEVGFMSPVGINTRAADSPPNGIFRCSTISLWLGADGMFRQERPYPGMLTILNHIKGMTREWGYPVAPEAWESDHKSWGSRYYNWDIALVCPMIEWLAGIDYSIPESTFTVAPNLPPSWDFIETYTPVVLEGKTNWVRAHVSREKEDNAYHLKVDLSGSPMNKNAIKIHPEDRNLLGKKGSFVKEQDSGQMLFEETNEGAFANMSAELHLNAEKNKSHKSLIWVTPRTRIFHKSTLVQAENLTPGTIVRYTKDGSVPDTKSPVFPDQGIEITNTTEFRFRAFGDEGSSYMPFDLTFEDTELLPAADIDRGLLETGLDFVAYEIPPQQKRLPDFSSLKELGRGHLDQKGVSNEIVLDSIQKKIGRNENYALHLTGFLDIQADQVYNIKVHSDDGSHLLIDGQSAVELNSSSDYDPWIKDDYIGLKKGLHRVDIYYYQAHHRSKLLYEMRPGDDPILKKIPAKAWKRMK